MYQSYRPRHEVGGNSGQERVCTSPMRGYVDLEGGMNRNNPSYKGLFGEDHGHEFIVGHAG